MKLSAEYLEGLAAETGFRAATLEKVIRLGEARPTSVGTLYCRACWH
jgi:hypothetical protein